MNMEFSLTDELAQFVESKIATGRDAWSSEGVHEALRSMETIERQAADRPQSLRAAWRDGIDSGDAGEMDFAALKAEARGRTAAPKA